MIGSRCTLVLLIVFTVTCYIESANMAKFLERDHVRDENAVKRNYVIPKAIKKTITPNTKEAPNSEIKTPDTTAETPDTPDTPDTKDTITSRKNTKTTQNSSGESSGSGESQESGDNDIQSGTKKSRISSKPKIKKVKATKDVNDEKSIKKQFLGMPNQKEGLGGEPVDLNAEGGIGGLGGDMEGIPTGMGAGAEPLGAYDPGNVPPPHALEGGVPQNMEDPFTGGPPPGFAKGPQEGDVGGEMVEGPPPGMRFGKQGGIEPGPGEERQPFDEGGAGGFQGGPVADMTESMSNSIAAMDKANIQGDGDVGPQDPNIQSRNFYPQYQDERDEAADSKQQDPVKLFKDSKEEKFWTNNGDIRFDGVNQGPSERENVLSDNNMERELDHNQNFEREDHDEKDEMVIPFKGLDSENQNINMLLQNYLGGGGHGKFEKALDKDMPPESRESFNAPIPNVPYPNTHVPSDNESPYPVAHVSPDPESTYPVTRLSSDTEKPEDESPQDPLMGGNSMNDVKVSIVRGGNLAQQHESHNVFSQPNDYDQTDGFTREPLPLPGSASLVPNDVEMTAVSSKMLDMAQVALEKRKKVQRSKKAAKDHSRYLNRDNAVNTPTKRYTVKENHGKSKTFIKKKKESSSTISKNE